MLLGGPYPATSNRIIRQYVGYEHCFIRVDFRDEDLLPYRETQGVDVSGLIRERVGSILKHGFYIAGRHHEFLGYSMSGFRNQGVWFVAPFQHATFGCVTSETIRRSVGEFKATVPSVRLQRWEWEEVEDLGSKPHQFTDGAGTIARSLGRIIWAALRSNSGYQDNYSLEPLTYQIRFRGYKGIVTVDEHFDTTSGILMRLRPSMKKFETTTDIAEIEIVKVFNRPLTCFLNKPVVMVLEKLGVKADVFLELQDRAVADIHVTGVHGFNFRQCRMLDDYGLGEHFRLSYIFKNIATFARESSTIVDDFLLSPFLRQVQRVVKSDILRDIKYRARVAIPGSYLLVGVPDEGPAYQHAGRTDVYILPEKHIYVCIQNPGDLEPTWLIQCVYAIGRPPSNTFCAFSHLKNVVVLPSVGRSLASCLGGGDVDGDMFSVIFYPQLLPSLTVDPNEYRDSETMELGRDTEVQDICDFIVNFMITDVLGLLSERLLDILDLHNSGTGDETWHSLARMCAQAADYPKRGVPVDMDHDRLPHTLIPRKPDWRAAGHSPGSKGFYTSASALGLMYRAINLDDTPSINLSDRQLDWSNLIPLLRSRMEEYVFLSDGDSAQAELEKLFRRFVHELSCIRSSYSMSRSTGEQLCETEIVVGTILSRTSSKRWRMDHIKRMKVHTATLVAEVRKALHVPVDLENAARQELVDGLQSGWEACNFSAQRGEQDGASSFGLIALGVIFDCHNMLTGITARCRY
ncbi:hypothetical protein D9615_004173 [Tricholomella constricta]|uniref:RNA-dependent RNA polymerase n=1 Tax=Tricholomella constricta TaxID=117010 RepID=A0A8H5HDL9_9AGAR|nr:hypothetical protein D9615_004173 [Tricholomella constricta]